MADTVMPSREQMIAELQSQAPSRDQMIQDLQRSQSAAAPEEAQDTGLIGSAMTMAGQAVHKARQYAPAIAKPVFTAMDTMVNTEAGRKAPGYLGGLVRTGAAALGGVTQDGDWAKAFSGEAPSPAEYLTRAGVPKGPNADVPFAKELVGHDVNLSARDVLGGVLGAALDPLALYAGKGMGNNLKTAVGEAAETAGSATVKPAAALFRVPAPVIRTYAEGAERINEAFKAQNGSLAAVADEMRNNYGKAIDSTRAAAGDKIAEALKGNTATLEAAPILGELEAQRAKLNPVLKAKERGEINGIITQVKTLANMPVAKQELTGAADLADFLANRKAALSDDTQVIRGEPGKLTVQDAHDLKQHLQELATAAYRNPGESPVGTVAANAAKSAGAITRRAINTAVPEVAAANNELAWLHTIEDRMNKSLIKEGSAESGLIAAGKGNNSRNALALEHLGKATGTDMMGPAKDLAAMEYMGDAKYTPGLGAVPGAAIGGAIGSHVPVLGTIGGAGTGAAIGGAMTSPAVLKGMIDVGRLSGSVMRGAGNLPGVSQTLGTSVIHGGAGVNAIRREGQ